MHSDEKKKLSVPAFSVREILEQVPDIDGMDLDEITGYRQDLEEALARLDAVEPKNENSEAYDDWAEEHEDLEDLIDEVLDRIEELT